MAKDPRTAPIPAFTGVIPVATDLPRTAPPIETAGADMRAMASGFGGLADSFSKLADAAAKREGEQQGMADGAAADFTPLRNGTIRGEARDAAGQDRYMRELDTRLRQGLDQIALQSRDLGEAEVRSRIDTFVAGMRDAIPETNVEARVVFSQAATRLGWSHVRDATERRMTREDQDTRTTLEHSLQERMRSLQRIAYGAGDNREAHGAMAAELDAFRTEVMASTTLPAGAKRRLIANAEREANEAVIYGMFDREQDPAKRQAILTRFRDEYTRGEGVTRNLTGDQFRKLESHMSQGIARAATVDQRALNQLERDMNDLVEQSRQATPATSAAWAAIESRAAGLAGGGRVIQLGQAKLQLQRELQGLPVEEQDRRMRALEAEWRSSGPAVRAGVDMANLSDSAQRMLRGIQSVPGLPRFEITSGYRDPSHNHRARGANNSQHIHGNALDISTRGWTDEQRGSFLSAAIANGARGIGIYPNGSLHIDTRANVVMWGPNGYSGSAVEDFPAWAQPHLRQLQASGGRDAPSAADLQARPTAPSGGGGFSSDQAELIQFGRKQVDDARTMLGRDPLGYADRYLRVPVAPLDWGGDAVGIAGQIGERVATAEAIGRQLRRDPTYLRPDEVERMREIVNAGGVQGTAVVQAIVQGAGTRAPAILKEIGGSAPALAQAGVIVASGAPRQAADDLLEAQRLKAVDGFRLPAMAQAQAMRMVGETLGGALDQYPEDRARIIAAANDIYGVRAARQNLDGKDSASQEAYRRALQDAVAATRQGGRQFGGIAVYRPGWWSAYRVAVPNDVDTDRFGQVIRSIRDEDLASLPVPPRTADGRAFRASDIHGSVPVRYGDGYRFAQGDPRSDDPKWIRGADGNPFVLPWATVAPTLRSRVPGAFLGGG